MTLLDEACIHIIELNSSLEKDLLKASTKFIFTAGVTVKFLKPVCADTDVSVVARLDEMTSRQVKVAGEMLGPRGEALATAETPLKTPKIISKLYEHLF